MTTYGMDIDAACAAQAREDAAYARMEGQQEEQRANAFDVDAALYIGRDDDGVYVHLAADPTGSGYLLHMVVDNLSYCETLSIERIETADERALIATVHGACEYAADLVREWGLRRPGTSRISRSVRRHVRDAMHERADIDMERDAATEMARRDRECAP